MSTGDIDRHEAFKASMGQHESARMAAVPEVGRLMVWSVSLNCPHCEASQDGWVVDPRGNQHECDDCGKLYMVPADVRIAF